MLEIILIILIILGVIVAIAIGYYLLSLAVALGGIVLLVWGFSFLVTEVLESGAAVGNLLMWLSAFIVFVSMFVNFKIKGNN